MRLLFVGLVVALAALFVLGCAPRETEKEPTVPQPTPAPQPTERPTPTTPPAPEPSGGEEAAAAEVLSAGSCTDGKLRVTVTNTGESVWNVSELQFRTNAAIDDSPDCEDENIAVGDSTVCSGLDRVVLKGRTNIVQLILPDKSDYTLKITCE